MKHIISIILICWTLTKHKAEAFYYDQSDFGKVKETSYFVDKTWLIKDFIDEDGSVKVITAPSKFGKSTIIDMVKRFVGIQVSRNTSDVKPVHRKDNLNYAIFCKIPLKICRESKFVEKHFGRYPVVQIDYSRLKCLWNFESILTAMREVLLETYAQHSYLLEESLIWPAGELSPEDFRLITNPNVALSKSEIEIGFKLLPEILHNYFERKVIILLDEYDVYWENRLFRTVNNETEVVAFLTAITEHLFKSNVHLERALLTGTANVKDALVSGCPESSRNYRFLADHVFSEYYGFTGEEVRKMATKSGASAKTALTSLRRYYDGYLVRSRNVTVYNPLSVMTFFARRMKYDQYWIQTNYLDGISEIYKASPISDAMKMMLIGATVKVNVARPFDRDQMLRLCRIHENLELVAESDVELVFRYLFDLGRLSPTIADSAANDGPAVALKIANTEVQQEFGRLLRKNYQISGAIGTAYVQVYQEAFNRFEPGKNMSDAFIFFTRSVFNFFFENYKICPTSENDIQSMLLAFAAETFKLGSTWSEGDPEKIELLVLNDHNVAVILGTKFQRAADKHERFTTGQLAEKALNHVKDKYRDRSYVQSLLQVDDSIVDIKYVGLGYREDVKGISAAG